MLRAVLTICLIWSTSTALGEELGEVTNLPIPRFVSMKASEGYARRGPSRAHRIDWVFKHRNTPLLITDEYGHWRHVEDVEGQGGWMHFRLLSGVRTVVFTGEETLLRRRGYTDSQIVAKVEKGVVGRLQECTLDWCKISVDGARGWAVKTNFWGAEKNELRD